MSLKGGYKIINFNGLNVSTTGDSVKFSNIWNEINTDKPLLFSGLSVDSVALPDMFVTPIVIDNNKRFKIAIDVDEDALTATDIIISPNNYVGAESTSMVIPDPPEPPEPEPPEITDIFNVIDLKNTDLDRPGIVEGIEIPGISASAWDDSKPHLVTGFQYQYYGSPNKYMPCTVTKTANLTTERLIITITFASVTSLGYPTTSTVNFEITHDDKIKNMQGWEN